MSKRYPPIYSVITLIALVTVAATNTNGAALYVASADCDRNGFCSYGERKEVKNAIS